MSLPVKGLENKKDRKPSSPRQMTSLNPNAAEFVPSSLRSAHGNSKANNLELPGTSTEVALDKSGSATSTNSDDDAGQFWLHQLPEDIIPDFAVTEDSSSPGKLSLSGLSIYEEEATRVPATTMSRQLLSSQVSNGLTQKLKYSPSIFSRYQSTAFIKAATDSRDNHFSKSDQHLNYEFDGRDSKGISDTEFVDYVYDNHCIMEDSAINHVQFLALQFPGFSADRLADLYYANACDLNMTIEILTQLELQIDAGIAENQNFNVVASPSGRTDFHAHTGTNSQIGFSRYNGDNMHKNKTFNLRPSTVYRGAPDCISAVGNFASQNDGTWKPERNPMSPVGGSRGNSQLLNIAYESQAKLVFDNKLQGFGSARSHPVWLEAVEPVENTYTASRWDPRDYARLHHACFQQAREAYLIGNKVLAKKLGDKGKWFNLQMKEAHVKAREAFHRQRNPFSFELQDDTPEQDRVIDLRCLHANEALHVLKHELGLLKNAARSGGNGLHVLIFLETSQHANGAATPATLPIAVEQYLSEEDILHTQPQLGLFRAIMYP